MNLVTSSKSTLVLMVVVFMGDTGSSIALVVFI
jgi:hypothetical protein